MSTGVEAMKMPLRPPMRNSRQILRQKHRRGETDAASPESTEPVEGLMADGTAMTMVVIIKPCPRGFMPLMNMWWPQTIHERKAMAIMEKAMA